VSIKLGRLIGDESVLPPLQFGEVHACLSDSRNWLLSVVKELSKAHATQVFLSRDTHRLLKQVDANASLTAYVGVAEWKYRSKMKQSDLFNLLDKMSQHADCIVFISQFSDPLIAHLLNDRETLLLLARWALNRNKLVWVAYLGDETTPLGRSWLRAHRMSFTSMHLMEEGRPFSVWTIMHWFVGDDLLQEEITLQRLSEEQGGGYLKVTPFESEGKPTFKRLAGSMVYAVSDAVKPTEIAPNHWQMLSHTARLEDAFKQGSNDTLIIHDSLTASRKQLIELVYRIRSNAGPFLKIIIREVDYRIRHHDERILVNAGATYVAPKPLSLDEIDSIIDCLPMWQFEGNLPELATLQQLFVPSEVEGYLAPPQFSQQVRRMTELANYQKVDIQLIVGVVATGIKADAILSRFAVRRQGDVCTAVGNTVYIFLFACEKSEVDRTLLQLLGFSSRNLFSREARFDSTFAIKEALDELLVIADAQGWRPPELVSSSPDSEQNDNQFEYFHPLPAPVARVRGDSNDA